MNASSSQPRIGTPLRIRVGIVLMGCFLAGRLAANSIMPASPAEYLATNQTVRVQVIPGAPVFTRWICWRGIWWEFRSPDRLLSIFRFLDRPKPCVARVQQTGRSGRSWSTQWQVRLTNQEAPYLVLVPSRADSFVAVDDWGVIGISPFVLAFYDPTGLRRTYSLDELLASQGLRFSNSKAETNRPAAERNLPLSQRTILGNQGDLMYRYWNSVGWQYCSRIELDEAGPEVRLMMFLPWTGRWLGWRLPDGAPVPLNEQERDRWNQRGLSQARADLERSLEPPGSPPGGSDDVRCALYYLAFVHEEQDRALLERAVAELRNDPDPMYPQPQKMARQALEIWDGQRSFF